MDPNILRRYFINKYSRKDFFRISSAFHQKDENINLENQMKEHWMNFEESELPDVQLNLILDKLQHRIYLDESGKIKKRVGSLWQFIQRVAAVLLLTLLIASVMYNNWSTLSSKTETSLVEIQCPLGVRTKVHLPDGSTVYLNSGSVLKYPASFNNNRNVQLTGEGYFDVKHNEKAPFHVNTKNLDIKVLGTTFNVAAYEGEKSEEIILQSGHVDVSDQFGNRIASLTPDQRLVIEKQNMKFNLEKVVSQQYTSWKEGKLMFRNEKIDDVSIKLSRWYNVEIVIDKTDSRIMNYAFHGTFVDEQIQDVLKVLTVGAPISYREIARKNDQNDIYLKRKIILSINLNKIKNFE